MDCWQSGVRPFVELSFMPRKLAAQQILHPFWYKPIVSPPKDWSKWGDLIAHFAQHLVDRYGIERSLAMVFRGVERAEHRFLGGRSEGADLLPAVRRGGPVAQSRISRLRVGGPATAQAAWVDRFIRHCFENHMPLDFVSTHVYGNDSAQDVFGTRRSDSPDADGLPRGSQGTRSSSRIVASETADHLERIQRELQK